jgi:glucose dehydrogenase
MFLKPAGWRMRRMKYGIIGLVLMLVLVIAVNVPYAAYVIFAILVLGAAIWIIRRETYRQQ